ncbi:MAG: S8 family serine peptidase [Atopobiaceae bacterium]|jgi:hypothetical protein|nr:S8 family serine peptidase [Atopobiaceae bacterium]MCH4181535.1 S8 family serine peptidase [Atopobiaceae bacterium]MCH4215133.1 S8 family serine peptidase [Atopobiaceae bacterium]MCH4277252.1 S8 family serine peptidase [Atopobiaceae bacterium]MCI1225905.1 S8 family serine peptidase [Atopobiaceae bacterium]
MPTRHLVRPASLRASLVSSLSVVLVLSGVPVSAHADATSSQTDASTSVAQTQSDSTTASTSTTSDKDTQIADLLAEGDYTQGEVVATVYGRYASVDDWFASSSDASSESLLDTTASTYAVATDESVAASAEDETVTVILISNPDMTCEQMLDALWDDPRILMVEPNYVVQASTSATGDATTATSSASSTTLSLQGELATSSSTGLPFSSASSLADGTSCQWAMDNDGSTMYDGRSYVGFDINSPGWGATGEENAAGVVAVMDSGIDCANPDLEDVVLDDMETYNSDGGPHGIDVSGFGDPKDITDEGGHGTHCAGTIAAAWNGYGTSGVANGVKLCGVKVYNSDGALTLAALARGYAYLSECVDNGLNLVAVNNSWGDREITKTLDLLVTQLGEKGVVSVFSSGNEGSDSSYNPRPSSALKDNPYAIVVDATNKNGLNAYNFGQSTTNVMAPGVGILSTASQDATGRGAATYVSALDGNPLVSDTYEQGTTDQIKAYKSFDLTTLAATDQVGQRSTDLYAEGAQSLCVAYDDQTTDDVSSGYGSLSCRATYLKVPMGGYEDSVVFGCDVLQRAAGDTTARLILVRVAVKAADGTVDWSTYKGAASFAGGSEWLNLYADTSTLLTDGQTIARDADGAMTVEVLVMDDGTAAEPSIYLDRCSLGTSMTPYLYLSGTSMAAPMVCGAAAVAAKDQGLDNAAPVELRAQLARDRVAWVESHVNQYDGRFLGMCTSGGQIDLSVTAQKTLPVISTAAVVDGSDPTEVKIEGSDFTSSGSVTIASKAAEVVSWSDGEIVVKAPDGLTSGVLPVSVTTSAGTCTKAFLMDLSSASDKPLFERDIAMPSELSDSSMDNQMLGVDGGLLVFTQDQFKAYYQSDQGTSNEIGSYRHVWRYDASAGTWKQCADLPDTLNSLSVTMHDGQVIACGAVLDWTAKTLVSHLYSYDLASDTWQALDATNVPPMASIADVSGQLVLVGGASGFEDSGMAAFGTSVVPLQKDDVATLDLASGQVEPVASLATEDLMPKIAVDGSSIYVCQGKSFSSVGIGTTSGMARVTNDGGSWTTTDLASSLPSVMADALSATKIIHGTYGIASTSAGVIISGVLAYADSTDTTFADADTYVLSDGATSFVDFGKRAAYEPIFYSCAASSGGWLYVMGSSAYDDDVLILRATQIDAEPTTPTTPTTPTSPDTPDATTPEASTTEADDVQGTDSQVVPKTADETLPAAPIALSAAALLGGALVLRRRRG